MVAEGPEDTKDAERRPGEATFAGLLVVFSAFACWRAFDISGFDGLATPGVFPMLASGAMLAASLVALVGALGRRGVGGGLRAAARRFGAEVATARLFAVGALMTAFVFATPHLGFLLSAALFLFSALMLLWRRGALVALVTTAALTGAIHVIFREIFQVVLPEGRVLQGLF